MKKYLLLLVLVAQIASAQSRDTLIILNEVMFNPPAAVGSNSEYLELFNISFTDSVNLSRWRFGDTNRQDTIQFPTGAIWLRPRQYAVLAGRNGFDSLFRYNVPPQSLQLRLPTSSVGNGLGNAGDVIYIRNAAGDTIQTYAYSTGLPAQGVSLEKRITNRDNSASNWGNGISFGTAGRQNSLAPANFDLSISSPSIVSGRIGDTVQISYTIRNRGALSFGSGTQIKLFPTASLFPIQSSLLSQTLSSNDSLVRSFAVALQSPVPSGFTIVLENAQDENRLNDTARTALQALSTPNVDTNIIFSEILYDPPLGANSTADEFLEVFNTSFIESINLQNWRIDNLTLSDTGAGETILAPRSYATIFGASYFTAGQFYRNDIPLGTLVLKASGSLSLSNSGDNVLLRNPQGDTIARVSYVGRSQDKGFSLEKILLTRNDSSSNYARSLNQRGSPGRTNSITPKNFDLSLSSPSILQAQTNETIQISFTVRNRGIQPFGAGSEIRLFEDRDGSGFPNPTAPISSTMLPQNLSPNDSLSRSFSYSVPQTIPTALIVTLLNKQDEDTSNNLTVTTLRVARLIDTNIVITEVMYDPPLGANSTADEFLEVFNTSSDTPLNLQGWRLDGNTLSDTGNGNAVLQPRSFAIIFGSSYFTTSQFYRASIPKGALVLKSSGSLGFTNSGDNILLRNSDGDTISQMTYIGDDEKKGFSLEKVTLNRDNAPLNFAVSTRQGGTPATQNTATPKQRDLSLSSTTTLTGEIGSTLQIVFIVKNRGVLPFGNGAVVSLLENGSVKSSFLIPADINPQDSIAQTFSYTIPTTPSASLLLRVDAPDDDDTLNNAVSVSLRILSPTDAKIIFSELMIDPPDGFDSDNNEFIELYNANSDSIINLKDWRLNSRLLADTGSGNAILQPRSYAVIFPKDYFSDTARIYDRRIPSGALVLKASGSLGLTNSGATVALINPSQDTVAVVRYAESSVQNQFSLEKKILNRDDAPTNYAASLFIGGTPAQTNSISRISQAQQGSVVVNEILYQPIQSATDFQPDQPDWIEVVNRSNTAIDLSGWSLSNAPNEKGEFETYRFAVNPEQNYILQPNELAVISSDRSKLRDTSRLVRYYKNLAPSAKLFFADVSEFANSVDGGLIWLRDNSGGTIDSVRYSPNWHSPFFSSTRGITLERINPNFPSNDRRSWTSSTNRDYGGTPAQTNSVFAESFANENVSGVEVKPNPFSPDGDGREDNCVIAYTFKSSVNRIRVRIYDVRGRLVRTLANSEPSGSKGEIVWDGFGETREKLRIGIYIILLEALDANSSSLEVQKKTVVLARPL